MKQGPLFAQAKKHLDAVQLGCCWVRAKLVKRACSSCVQLCFFSGFQAWLAGWLGCCLVPTYAQKNPQTWILLSSRTDNLCLQHTSQALHRYRVGSNSFSSLLLVLLVLFLLLLLLLCWVCCFFFLSSWREDRGSKVSFPVRFFLVDVKRR